MGSTGVPVCLSGTSVKRVERESVKRLSTTPLNSRTQGRTWQLAHMHRDTACEKVVNIVHLTPGTKHPASLYDSLPSDLQGNEDWSTCAPSCTNTQPPPNPYVKGSQACTTFRVQELCESRSGRPGPGLSVLSEPYGFCGRKATLDHAHALVTVCP